MRLYLAGPYSHKTKEEREHNVGQAREAMVQLLAAGHSVFCPHTLTDGLEHDDRLTYEDFMRNDLDFLRLCDGIVMLPGWGESKGSQIECNEAWQLSLKCWYWEYEFDRRTLINLLVDGKESEVSHG
jgi:hypothetical protein